MATLKSLKRSNDSPRAMEPTATDTRARRSAEIAEPQAYPEIDFDRAHELARTTLAEANSDSEAISLLLDDSVQVVHQKG